MSENLSHLNLHDEKNKNKAARRTRIENTGQMKNDATSNQLEAAPHDQSYGNNGSICKRIQ